ncbi:MAG: gliding motility protein GldC [Chitinophagaceae bacterium]
MAKSTITIEVEMDENRIPAEIFWKASDSTAENFQKATAMMIAFWDAADKSALRIDLWTKEMMVDEMGDFFYQTLMTMADTYRRATQQEDMCEDMKNYARAFFKKVKYRDLKENKATE